MQPPRLRSLLVCALPSLVACAAPPLPESTTDTVTSSTVPDWSAFTLGPNDRVHVGVYGQPDFVWPADGVRVAPDGTLSVPLLGAVPVAGKTADEARVAIEAGLAEYLQEFSVTVSVIEYSSRRLYLFGEVEQPGPYPMDRPIRALEALSMGYGFRAGANRKAVVILRRHGDEDVEVILFNAETPGPDGLVQILPDDLIFVSKSGVGVFTEEVLPYLTGLGFTLSQVATVTLALDRL